MIDDKASIRIVPMVSLLCHGLVIEKPRIE